MGEYVGNYLLTEKVEVKTNRLELTDPGGILLELDNICMARPRTIYFKTTASRSTFVLKDAVGGVDVHRWPPRSQPHMTTSSPTSRSSRHSCTPLTPTGRRSAR